MSIRSLVEINHDFYHTQVGKDFVPALQRYLASGSRDDARELERFGLRVIGMRRHADKFIVQGEPDGFPVRHLPPREVVGAFVSAKTAHRCKAGGQ